MIFLSIDPHAKFYAIARYQYGNWSVMVCDRLGAKHIIGRQWYDAIVIEDQYLGVNFRTARELAKAAGLVEGLAMAHNYQVFYVNPAKWQSYWGLLAIKDKKAKQVSMVVLAAEICIMVKTVDEASAILMGRYWMLQHGY